MEALDVKFTSDELFRFESLGDNCEFGLVLRSLQSESGGIFRWALTNVKATTAAIASDFSGLYERTNLVPHSKIMVRDTVSGIAYHTELKSHDTDSGLAFVHKGKEWARQYYRERRKFTYLKDKFKKKLEDPQSIFVIKSNRGISPEDVSKLHGALSEKSGRKVKLVHVQQRRAGQTRDFYRVSPSIAVGYIDRFAPYANADDSLKDQWKVIMRSALDEFSDH